jgi:hypothetical protein
MSGLLSQREIEKLKIELDRVLEKTRRLEYVDPITYIEDRFGIELDEWQKSYCDQSLYGDRIAIVACRQSGKSTVTSGFAAWLMRTYPGSMVLVASKSLNQAAYFVEKIRLALTQDFAGRKFIEDNKRSLMAPNASRVVAIPAMNPDAGRGYSPDLIILDEAAFAHDNLLTVLSPSLSATGGALHMISSPNGPVGQFYEAVEGRARDAYWSIRVTHRDCPRITEEHLAAERMVMSNHMFRQEYEAEFVSAQGAFFGVSALRTLLEDREDTDYTEFSRETERMRAWDQVLGIQKVDMEAAFDRADRVRRALYAA